MKIVDRHHHVFLVEGIRGVISLIWLCFDYIEEGIIVDLKEHLHRDDKSLDTKQGKSRHFEHLSFYNKYLINYYK